MGQNTLEITEQNLSETTSKGVTLVDFWAPWCGPCKMIGPIVEKIAEEMEGKAKVGKCNVDEAQNLAGQLGIQGIPTLIVFKDGKEVDRIVGAVSKNKIEESLNAVL